MYTYNIACRDYPIPSINIREKIYDFTGIIHYFTSDMYKISKTVKNYDRLKTKNKKCIIEEKAREWLAERLNKLLLGTACINPKCQKELRNAKNLIDNTQYNFFWDRVKVLVNPYELIYFTSKKTFGNKASYVAAIDPLSRSFFKMIEMGNIAIKTIINSDLPIISVHLAEGPGGFIEALSWLRENSASRFINYDKYYGMTLINNETTDIPSWKKSLDFLRDNPLVNILTGVDGTGNLYSIDNLQYLAKRFKINKADLVTADGGFDFTAGGYNNQEHVASKLIFAEIIGALVVLKYGGTFICKLFDLNNKLTADLIYLIQCHFQQLSIFKPKTSRLANSEKYIIASGYKGYNENVITKLFELLNYWNYLDEQNENIIKTISTNWHISASKHTNTKFCTINSIYDVMEDNLIDWNTQIQKGKIYAPVSFYTHLNKLIEKMNQLQINNINQTIDIITNQTFYDVEWLTENREKQLENARRWCLENNIPYC